MRRIFPHPILSLILIVLWTLLQNEFSVGQFVLALFLGISIPKLTSHFWTERPIFHSFTKIFAFFVIVIWDIILANITVAKLVLFASNKSLRSRWLCIPLDLTSPEGKTTLAAVITLTPGTVSADFSADGKDLLVHCLDTPDVEKSILEIKERYEARLKEIFP